MKFIITIPIHSTIRTDHFQSELPSDTKKRIIEKIKNLTVLAVSHPQETLAV
jgi:hypothetical protein